MMGSRRRLIRSTHGITAVVAILLSAVLVTNSAGAISFDTDDASVIKVPTAAPISKAAIWPVICQEP